MPLIKLLDVPNNAGGARPRSGKVISVDVPTEVTNDELAELGAFAYEVLDENDAPAEVPAEPARENTFFVENQPAEKSAEENKVDTYFPVENTIPPVQ